MNALRTWWRRRLLWYRFTRGVCVDCGVGAPLHGATICRGCFVRRYPYMTGTKP